MKCFFQVLLLFLPLTLFSFSILDDTNLYRTEQYYETYAGGLLSRVAVYQDYIYTCGERGLSIYHLNGDTLDLADEWPLTETSSSLYLYEDTLFFFRGYETLLRYSLADPAVPALLDSLSWLYCSIFFEDNGYFYINELLSNYSANVCHIFDAETFTELTQYNVPYCQPYGTSVLYPAGDGLAFINQYNENPYALHIFDISDIYNIHEIYEIPISNYYIHNNRVSIFQQDEQTYMLYSDVPYGFKCFDITDPANPDSLWCIDGRVSDFTAEDNLATVLFKDRLMLIDFTNATQPQIVVDQPIRSPNLVCKEGSRIVTAGAYLTVHQFDGGSLEQLAQTPIDGALDYTACDGNFLYLGSRYQSLVEIDIRNPVPPVPSWRFMPEPNAYTGLIVSCGDSTIAYHYGVNDDDDGHRESTIYRVGADGALTEISPVGEVNMGIPQMRGDSEMFMGEYGHLYRYAVSGNGIEQVEDLAIPDIGFCFINHYGEYLYIANGQRMLVVYAPQNGSMELVNDFGTEYEIQPRCTFIDHYMLYSGLFDGEQTPIYDISDPANPTFAYNLFLAGPMGIDAENGLLFIGIDACNVYDLSPLLESGAAPEFVSSFTSSDNFTGFFPLSGDRIICVDRTGVSLITYDPAVATQDDPAPPARLALAAYPNPFNPETTVAYSLSQAGHVRLCAYNVRGQRVATLVNTPMPAGEHTAQWAATGLPSGVYLLRLDAGGRTQTTKALLLK